MMRPVSALACVLAVVLSGCSAIRPPQPPGYKAGPPPVQVTTRKGQSGGVFVPEAGWMLTADRRALRAGDILTVTLQETTIASKKADTQIGKESSIAVQPITAAGRALKTDLGFGSANDFTGTASSSQENSLVGAITVIVQEVLPNGLLRVEGEKNLYLNQGEEMVRLSGYVRADDIDKSNQVSSLRVANARIVYTGRGTLADANNAGWLTRFFISPWMPF